MNFFIIHGIYGHPEENWFPWLKEELEQKGYEVIVPKFPTPVGQSLESWLKIIKKYEDKINADTVMIGHSLGANFILNYLEQSDREIKAAFLVAGWHRPLENEFKELNKSFDDKKFNWSRIIENCGHFFVIGSDNDEYISIETTRQLAVLLDAELHIIKNGGHLNKKAGFEKFPQLLELINKSINSNS
ncbi:serine hydrolase family protein [Candidatus Woesearchaeota archaeon]|nr:serine hydrolase family protein [Candidatus Woesearchaeota archaeon]